MYAGMSVPGKGESSKNLISINAKVITSFCSQSVSWSNKVKSDYQNSFKIFALELKKWNDAPTSTNFGNRLFKDGFCNVPLDLIQAFREQSDIQWGGMDWNSSNIDYMHFEINESKTVDYLKKP